MKLEPSRKGLRLGVQKQAKASTPGLETINSRHTVPDGMTSFETSHCVLDAANLVLTLACVESCEPVPTKLR